MFIRHSIHTNRIDRSHPYLTVPHEDNYLEHFSVPELFQVIYDDISGKKPDVNESWKAQDEELAEIVKHKLYTKVPIAECIEKNGKKPIAVRWVDINKGDDASQNYRSEIIANEFKFADRTRDDLLAATPPLEAKRALLSPATTETIGFLKRMCGKRYKTRSH